MEEPVPTNELTTTLHLGLRSVADSSPIALIEKLISESSAEEQSVLQGVMNGTGESAMVFIHRGPSRGARFLITSEGSTIGRAPSSDIFLDDVTVSRAHASIKRDPSGFIFTDAGSLNGSYINNEQKSSHRLTTGDEIQIVKGIPLADYVGMLDERALFVGQWGLKGARGEYEKMVEEEGRPRLRALLNEVQSQGWLEAAVVYGYFPCYSDGNDLVILHHEGPMEGQERVRFSFPRQRRDRRLCISDFFASKESGKKDVVAFHVVTMGNTVSAAANKLFEANNYREYLELHGLSVQLTEALAEHWHARVREEFAVRDKDAADLQGILDQGYRGSRYSFGYPACPDIEQQVQLCELLDPERIGVKLSEEFQLHPEQSTSAIIVHHPEAKYFNAN